MRILNTAKIPLEANPNDLLSVANRLALLNLKPRQMYSFQVNNDYRLDKVSSKMQDKTKWLTAAYENIFGQPTIVHIFAGFPAMYIQKDCYFGENDEVETCTYEEFLADIFNESKYTPTFIDLEEMLFVL